MPKRFSIVDVRRFWRKVEIIHPRDCWEFKRPRNRYGRCQFDGYVQAAHRISYQVSIGEIPKGLCVLHKCDNPACCSPSHLFLGTQADNVHDMIEKGRAHDNAGKGNGRARLSDSDVKRIRYLADTEISRAKLAKILNVSRSTIDKIVRRKTWKHV